MVLRSVVGALVLMGMVACGGGDSDGAAPDEVETGGGFSPAAPVAPLPASSVLDIALAHNALVFDASRSAYYASVPGSVVGTGNTIARIDASTGVVTYSRTIGSEPGPLEVARDGSALYVGLSGSGELVKLGLPNLEEQWRVRMPAAEFDGQLTAEGLSASPDNPDVIAVSLRGRYGNHMGVGLIRAGTLQPRRTSDFTGGNLITFGADSAFVYSFNNLDSEFGLRRLAVVGDGLVEETTVRATGANFGARTIDRMGSSFVVDSQVYAAPSVALIGQASGAGRCRPANQGARLLCFGVSPGPFGDGTVAVIDAVTYATVATPSYLMASDTDQTSFDELVPGSSGQVALRQGVFYQYQTASGLRLLSNPVLP